MHTLILVSTTFSRREDAERIGRLLLDRRLIACAHISGPITSIYRWQGEVHQEPEYTLTVKSTRQRWPGLQDALIREHPYELPEIVGRELPYASDAYGRWVGGEVDEV